MDEAKGHDADPAAVSCGRLLGLGEARESFYDAEPWIGTGAEAPSTGSTAAKQRSGLVDPCAALDATSHAPDDRAATGILPKVTSGR